MGLPLPECSPASFRASLYVVVSVNSNLQSQHYKFALRSLPLSLVKHLSRCSGPQC
uniref:Uncharacterized protein n=1 Tax=Ralstonia solanacearum CFBP2957 TaxID=859656 RepID=D8P681_RALSL|nr:protein of unknown function [Ralstonia solanacearum CFBP2957]